MNSKNSIIIPGLEDLPESAERSEKQIPPMGPIHSPEKPQHRPVDTQEHSPKSQEVLHDSGIE